jgi:uncharacterized protein YPO0396
VNPRVTLSRIIAVNWYGYRQFIDVHGLTLITGANGSGKSALLDLIQFVLLGEQTSRFNKAAAGAGSGRTLRGYCLCDTNTLGRDGHERYLRPSGVTLAGLEFSWPPDEDGTQRRETWGARIEYDSPTARPRTAWFCIPKRLEDSDFLKPGDSSPDSLAFLAEDEFRVRWRRDLHAEIWDRQTTYLDEMALRSHLGFGRPEMNKTLPSAMAFQPVENFERFIRDYLLEPALPDVRAVKASVDAHRRAQERLEKMADQHQRLAAIASLHATADAARSEAALWSHLRDALAHEEALESLQQRKDRLAALHEEHAANREAREAAITERNSLREQLEDVRREVFNDDGASRLDETRRRHTAAAAELKRLRTLQQSVRDFLHARSQAWTQWLRAGTSLGVPHPTDADADLELLRGRLELPALDASTRLARTADRLLADASDKTRTLTEDIRTHEKRERQIQDDLRLFAEGRSTPSPLLDALRSRGHRAVALGRIVEVTPDGEKWWGLLEALLASDRHAVIPDDFAAAWDIAQRTPGATESLLHPDEITALPSRVLPGSIRHFLQTTHPAASAWLDHRLGAIMPVRNAAALDRHDLALSSDGWLKEPPRRTKLVPERELSLGENGLKRLRATREEELASLQLQLTSLRRSRDDWNAWIQRGRDNHLNDFSVPSNAGDLRNLDDLVAEEDSLSETLDLLATPEREAAVKRMRDLESAERSASERAIRMDERIARADLESDQLRDDLTSREEAERSLAISREASRSRLPVSATADIDQRLAAARAQYPTWRQRTDVAADLSRRRESDAADLLRRRNDARLQLASLHPETAAAFDPADPDNSAYDRRERELAEQELPRFRDEAEKARREWEERLQHQVLDKIREKLEDAERTKRELNRAMDCEIGGWRYQISSSADRAHTAIWTLVEKGLPSGDGMDLFNAAARAELESAKAELMAAIEAADNPAESRHQRALDYRYYHRWRMMAQHAGRDASAADLDRIAKKQSGGENQAPFFVATLAAFRRVYDQSQRQSPPNLGLVVMDEAFSKLSGDRIDDCLALARNFGLQLLMAFPEDRLPTMATHADTIIQCRVERAWDSRDVVSSIENWVVRVNREQLSEALS